MEYQKITDLNKVSRLITKKLIEVQDQSGMTYNTNKQTRFKTSMLRSDFTASADERDRDKINRQVF